MSKIVAEMVEERRILRAVLSNGHGRSAIRSHLKGDARFVRFLELAGITVESYHGSENQCVVLRDRETASARLAVLEKGCELMGL